MKKCESMRKSVKNYETILPFSCCPLVFSEEPFGVVVDLRVPFLNSL